MVKEKKFEEMEAEVKEQLEKGNLKEVVKDKRINIWQELKKDPDLREALVPIPDHGMVASILLIRIEKRLENMEAALREIKK